jgi:hypothetical protein
MVGWREFVILLFCRTRILLGQRPEITDQKVQRSRGFATIKQWCCDPAITLTLTVPPSFTTASPFSLLPPPSPEPPPEPPGPHWAKARLCIRRRICSPYTHRINHHRENSTWHSILLTRGKLYPNSPLTARRFSTPARCIA